MSKDWMRRRILENFLELNKASIPSTNEVAFARELKQDATYNTEDQFMHFFLLRR